MNIIYLIYFILGVFIGLIPMFLLYSILGPEILNFLKLKKGRVLLYVLPYEKFVVGEITAGNVTFRVNDVDFSLLMPRKFYKAFKYIPFLIVDITEGYVAKLEEARELRKLEDTIGKTGLQNYIMALLRKRELDMKDELTDEEKQEYQQLTDYIQNIEKTFNFHIKELGKDWVITPIFKEELKNYYYDVNPATAFQFSQNLALQLARKFRQQFMNVMPYVILFIGAAIAVAIIWKIA